MKTAAVDWQENGSDYSDLDGQSDDESSSSHNHKKQSDYILGFEDGPMSRVPDQRDWNVSRLAGLPALLPLKKEVNRCDLECRNCGQSLYLISQIYCPHHLKDAYDRVLYLFGCASLSCQAKSMKSSSTHQCIRAFRSWKLNEVYAEKMKKEKQPDWRATSLNEENPFRLNKDPTGSASASNPFASGLFDTPDSIPWPDSTLTEASSTEPWADRSPSQKTALTKSPESEKSKESEPQELSITDKPTSRSKPEPDLSVLSLKSYYLTTCYEARPAMNLSKELDSLTISQGSSSRKVENKLNQAHSKRQPPAEHDDPNGGWKGEKYERQTIEGVDQTFLTFQERVSWCGQSNQVIRYKVGGNPLAFSRVDLTPVYRCDACGSAKAFEVQFMPVGVTLLNQEMPSGHGFTWSTMWVMTCTKDCHGMDDKDEEGWVEESVFLQWED